MPCRCDALSCLVVAGRSAPAILFYLRIVRVLLKYDFFTVPGSGMREVPKKNSAGGREACRRWPPDGQAKGPKRIVARKTGSGEGSSRSGLSSQNPGMERSSRSNRRSAQIGSADPSKRVLQGLQYPVGSISTGESQKTSGIGRGVSGSLLRRLVAQPGKHLQNFGQVLREVVLAAAAGEGDIRRVGLDDY